MALAHDLGLTPGGRGRRGRRDRRRAAGLGCDIAQGYAIARPMPVEDFLAWLADAARPLLDATRA